MQRPAGHKWFYLGTRIPAVDASGDASAPDVPAPRDLAEMLPSEKARLLRVELETRITGAKGPSDVRKLEFKQWEWEQMGILETLKVNDYIQVKAGYYAVAETVALPGGLYKNFGVNVSEEMLDIFETKCGMPKHKTREERGVRANLTPPPLSLDASSQAHDPELKRRLNGSKLKRTLLLAELFRHHFTEIYRGYVDDERNTDDAWIETTAHSVFCGNELGHLLDFEELPLRRFEGRADVQCALLETRPKGYWLDASDRTLATVPWLASHKKLVLGAIRQMRHAMSIRGHLSTAVGFGRVEFVEKVLRDPILSHERSPLRMSRVFQRALQRAASDANSDHMIIDALLRHGAQVSEVRLSKLFQFSTIPFVRDVLEHTASDSSATSEDAEAEYADPDARIPWPEPFSEMLEGLVDGFGEYCEERSNQVPVPFDLMCWAICCGRVDLAITFWERTTSPLRASLLGRQLCCAIRKVHHRRMASQFQQVFHEAEDTFAECAKGLLSEIKDQELARSLIMPSYQVREQLGCICGVGLPPLANFLFYRIGGTAPIKQRPQLELLSIFNNDEVASHHHCTGIIDEVWHGGHKDCGPFMLAMRPTWLQKLFMTYAAPFVALAALLLGPVAFLVARCFRANKVPIIEEGDNRNSYYDGLTDEWTERLASRESSSFFSNKPSNALQGGGSDARRRRCTSRSSWPACWRASCPSSSTRTTGRWSSSRPSRRATLRCGAPSRG